LYLLRRLFRIAPMITPKVGYLGQPLFVLSAAKKKSPQAVKPEGIV